MAKGFFKTIADLFGSGTKKSNVISDTSQQTAPSAYQNYVSELYKKEEPVLSETKPKEPEVKKINPKAKSFFKVFGDYKLSYEYQQNLCYSNSDYDDIAQYLGYDISFKKEPDNQYDSKAVAVYVKEFDKKIGYVFKGKTQDMINDWIDKELPFIGYLYNLPVGDDGKKYIEYKIAFYKEYDKSISKVFSLTRTAKKDFLGFPRIDNLECCCEGDTLDYDFDCDSETYVLTEPTSGEIGELPKSANNYIDSDGDNAVVIDKIYTDDNGKTKAKIRVYKI